MLTLFSTLLGFITSGLPKVLEFFQDRNDKKHELEIMQLQTERELRLQTAGFLSQEKIEEIKLEETIVDASIRERESLYAHDSSIGEGASTWIINLRASVRPVITYGMFVTLLFIDGFAAWYAYYNGIEFVVMVQTIWNQDTQSLWGTIVAFWFGSQQFQRNRN